MKLSFKASIGYTYSNDNGCNLFEKPIYMSIQEFEAMIGSTLAKSTNSLTPKYILKIWCIDIKKAKGAIEQNTQLFRKGANNELSKQFSTNDRKLQYTCIESEFYTDPFHVTSKAGRTTRKK